MLVHDNVLIDCTWPAHHFRLDRNSQGGRIAVYANLSLPASSISLPSNLHPSNFLTSSPLRDKISVVSDLFSLNQIVSHPTHYSHTGIPSTIDLVYIPSNLHPTHCEVLPVPNSDHNSILFSVPLEHDPLHGFMIEPTL